MATDPFSSLADMDRRFVSSNRRSADRRRREQWRGAAARKLAASVGVALTVVAGGYALSRLDLSLGGEAPAAAAAPASAGPLSGCPLPPEFRADFAAASRDADVPPSLLVAVAQVESRLDPGARSAAGAEGLLQLLPSTARELGLDPSLRRQNVMAGALYLRRMLDRFERVDLALAAYNSGPNAVARGRSNSETVAYVANVQRRAAALTACR